MHTWKIAREHRRTNIPYNLHENLPAIWFSVSTRLVGLHADARVEGTGSRLAAVAAQHLVLRVRRAERVRPPQRHFVVVGVANF